MRNLFSSLFLSKGVNYFHGDIPLAETLAHFGFKGDKDLDTLGSYVSNELIETLDFIDHHAKPVLHNWGIMGDRIDYVRLSPDHVRALNRLQELGVISRLNTAEKSLMYHFVSGYIISDSGIFCTLTLTAQTAYALQKYADKELQNKFLGKYFDSREPWYGATFYSETQGGSDIGANNTVAAREGNNYFLTGTDKYFASDAGIADGALVTARFQDSPKGAKGISLYFVPAYREDGTPNYSIRRLKDKLGTVAVPTGEVEFNRSEAYLIGRPEDGIYMAMEVLVISRIDDAIAAVGIARKALWEAYLYSNRRTSFGKKLIEHPLMLRDFIEREVELEASVVLSVLAADLFDSVTSSKPPYDDRYQIARMVGNMAKSIAADTSAAITRYSMEMMGGIGFFEEFPMAKFHRDSIVTSIWEGTSNIQALEVLEVILRKNGLKLFEEFLSAKIESVISKEMAADFTRELNTAIQEVRDLLAAGNPEFYSKEILERLGILTASIQMELIGQQSGRGGVISRSSVLYHKLHMNHKGLRHRDAEENVGIIKWMDH